MCGVVGIYNNPDTRKLIDDVLACTDRVLNPSAHSGTPPLYEKEVQTALELIKEMNSEIRVMMLTNYAQYIDQAMSSGAYAYLLKDAGHPLSALLADIRSNLQT